jgi:LAS superfamily LD-carboxypeptidase LdcB
MVRWLTATMVVLVLGPLLLFAGLTTAIGGGAGCAPVSDGSTVIHDGDIARTILDVGLAVGASERALLAAFEAALVESNMRNLDHGHLDSLGVFQQRPSAGWGSPQQVTDPVYAARAFFLGPARAGSEVGGNVEPGVVARDATFAGSAGQLAQTVQRSAFPERYDQAEDDARALLTHYTTNPPQITLASTAGSPTAVDGSPEWGGHANGRIPLTALASVDDGQRLRPDAAAAWNALQRAATADLGQPIGVTDSYRSYEAQVELKALKPTLAATPGRSNHGWGLAVDVVTGGWDGEPMRWLQTNAPRFGWHHPDWAQIDGSNPEHWHWEYRGGRRDRPGTMSLLAC